MLSKNERKIVDAVRVGGEMLRVSFGKNLKTFKKTMEADFTTKADLEIEEKIINLITKEFPGINILAEESGYANNNSDYTFVLDPLDGTNNFALGIPYFSVAAALMKGNKTEFACVYNPILDDIYYAKSGKGAYKNGKKILVSKNKEFKRATIAYVTGYSNIKDVRLDYTGKLYRKMAARILDNWCPTLDHSLLASGKIDCVIVNDDDLHESIIGQLIMKEAGAMLVDFKGAQIKDDKANKFIAVNNKFILKEILEVIK